MWELKKKRKKRKLTIGKRKVAYVAINTNVKLRDKRVRGKFK